MLSAVCGAAQWRGERRRSEGGCGEWLSWMLLHPAPTPQGMLEGEGLGDMGEGGRREDRVYSPFVIQYCTHYEYKLTMGNNEPKYVS